MRILPSWRLCGLLLGGEMICGCDGTHRLSPAPTPVAVLSAERSPSNSDNETRTERTDIVMASTKNEWELEPPKSVIAARDTTPHDPGAVFKHYCSVCHGSEGRGDGQFYSDELPSKPANLTDQQAMEILTDEHLTLVITGGSVAVGKSPLCPPWGRVFTKEQVAELVDYIRTLPSLAKQNAEESQETQEDQK